MNGSQDRGGGRAYSINSQKPSAPYMYTTLARWKGRLKVPCSYE